MNGSGGGCAPSPGSNGSTDGLALPSCDAAASAGTWRHKLPAARMAPGGSRTALRLTLRRWWRRPPHPKNCREQSQSDGDQPRKGSEKSSKRRHRNTSIPLATKLAGALHKAWWKPAEVLGSLRSTRQAAAFLSWPDSGRPAVSEGTEEYLSLGPLDWLGCGKLGASLGSQSIELRIRSQGTELTYNRSFKIRLT